MTIRIRQVAAMAVIWFVAITTLAAAELKPKTLAAFDRYIAVTEARIRSEVEGEQPFLWADRLAPDEQAEVYARLAEGEVQVERLETQDGDDKISIPSGLVHHWIGTVLIPGVSLESTIVLVRDYNQYAEFYRPNVRKASILEQDGDRFKVYRPALHEEGPHRRARHRIRCGVHCDRRPEDLCAKPDHADLGGRGPRHTR